MRPWPGTRPGFSTHPEKEMQIKVPFLDLDSHHQPRREEFSCAISEVVDSGALPEGLWCQSSSGNSLHFAAASTPLASLPHASSYSSRSRFVGVSTRRPL